MMAVAYRDTVDTQQGEDERLSLLLESLDGVRRSGEGYTAKCPAHDDGSPSLSIKAGDVKPVILKCFAGCTADDIIRAVDLDPRYILGSAAGQAASPTPATRGAQQRPQIVATYDYTDERGFLLYQGVRFEPKDFRQRRPDGRGDWVWKLADVRRVLYRLPELIAADTSETVYVVEGEKDVDRLMSLGFVATCNAGGASKWRKEYSDALSGRHVVILPDNDKSGREHAETVARSLAGKAASLRVVLLPGLPDKGDVSDWLDSGGTVTALDELVRAAQPWRVGEPATDADTPSPDEGVPAFPSHALPPSFKMLVEQGAAAMSCPPDFIGTPLVAAAGAAIGNALEIELKPGWREGANVYAAVVAAPGATKTPSMDLAISPLSAIQWRLKVGYEQEKLEYIEALAEWEASRKDKQAQPGPKPVVPAMCHVVTTDATTEALAAMFTTSKGVLMWRDELSGWIHSMDQYRPGGKGADRQHYLQMWSRSMLKVDRRTGDPVIVQRPNLSVVGGIQPDKLSDLVNVSADQDGFADRLLWSYPDTLEVPPWSEAAVGPLVHTIVRSTFEWLHRLEGETGADDESRPRAVHFDAEAKQLWSTWFNAWAAEMNGGDVAPEVRGVWRKLPSQLARLALILHCVTAAQHGPLEYFISSDTLIAAVELVDYYAAHARRVFGGHKARRTGDDERILVGLQSSPDGLTLTEITRVIFGGNIVASRRDAALDSLRRSGRATSEEVTGTGGPAAIRWRAAQ